MAVKYARAAGGNWGTDATWSTTSSAGTANTVAPTAADDVILDSGSGAVTINSGATRLCRSINCTGYTGTLTHNAATTLQIGDATAGASNIALKFVAGMTYTRGDTATSAISFVSTSATQQTIDWGGKTTSNVTFDGSTGSWIFSSAHTANGSTSTIVTLTRGTLNTNGQTLTYTQFSSNNSNTRALTLGASAIGLTGNPGGNWNITTSTGMTLSAGTSTITMNSPNTTFNGGSLTYRNVVLNPSAGGAINLNGDNTFNDLTITMAASTNRAVIGGDQVVNGTFTATGQNAQNPGVIASSSFGTARTITAAAVSITSMSFMDITAAGASSPWSGTTVGNLNGCTNINFTAAVTRYWRATSGGNWNATSSWAATVGGATGETVPLPQDTVVFDSSSITSTGRTITLNVHAYPNLDFTGLTNSPTIAFNLANGQLWVRGGLVLPSTVTVSGTTVTQFVSRTSRSITTNGVTLTFQFQLSSVGGTYTLGSALTISNSFTHNNGAFDAAGFNVSINSYSCTNSNVRSVTMGSGTWSINGTGTIWNFTTITNLTFSGTGSTLAITDTSSTLKSIIPGSGLVYGNITITGGGTGAVSINNNVTFNNFTIGAPKTVTFQSTATKTILGTFTAVGSSGNVITLNAGTPGSQFTLSKASGIVTGDWLSIQDSNATGGAYWSAGVNSTSVSNNTGWVFNNSVIVVADATNGHSVDNLALIQHFTLAIADALHAHNVDNVPITAKYTLVVNDTLHAHTVESFTITQKHNISVADSTHSTTVDNVVLTQDFHLAVADALHGHTVDNVALTQKHNLVVQSTDHVNSVDNVALTQKHYIIVDGTFHNHTVDGSLVLTVAFRRVIRVVLKQTPNRFILDTPA